MYKKITISEVAKLANVSTATVSRALNDSPTVKESTRQRILSVANTLEAQRTNNKMTSHVFSSAVGLTILVVTTQEEQKAPEGGAKGLFSRAFRWLMGY